MPEAKDILASMKKQYGPKKGERVYFAWKKAHPQQARKAIRTAQRHGTAVMDYKKVKPAGKSSGGNKSRRFSFGEM